MRLAIALCLAVLALWPATQAHADTTLASDTTVRNVYPLGPDLVYARGVRLGHPGPYFKMIDGHLGPAKGIPADALPGDIGQDRKGRTVFTFGEYARNGASLLP